MKDYGLLKLNANDKKRTLNYTTDNHKVYVLTKEESQKVKDILDNNQVELIFGANETVTGEAVVIRDIAFVKTIFDKMLNEGNTHFKVFKENLVVIEIKI